jgi:hypothetical protein
MLRITRMAESPSHVTLKLEGRIVSDWVSVVERECLAVLQEKTPGDAGCFGGDVHRWQRAGDAAADRLSPSTDH